MGFFDFYPGSRNTGNITLHALPGTTPLTTVAAILPPVIYYVALLLLPPFPNIAPRTEWFVSLGRNILALLAAGLFIRLPNVYYVPGTVGLTYILALIGLYGCGRIIDAFFISRYMHHHVPKRVKYHQAPRPHSDQDGAPTRPGKGPDAESYFSLHFLQPATGAAVTETARSDEGWPVDWLDRASWALEFETSMRGAGFAWTTADVRHTKRTWAPSCRDRLHSILVHVLPAMLLSWAVIRYVHAHYLQHGFAFDDCPYVVQAALTAALGGFLMSSFSFGHSLSAIMLSPLHPHPMSYFPPLYTLRVWEITTVRGFWSYGWHRLFARLFLVYGVWPGEWLERQLLRKNDSQPADAGKVLGAFISSAFVHAYASHTVMPTGWAGATGDAWFFVGNGVAVIVEHLFWTTVQKLRRQTKRDKEDLHRWYDAMIGRIWWSTVLMYTGRNFVRGWVQSGLVTEMAFMLP